MYLSKTKIFCVFSFLAEIFFAKTILIDSNFLLKEKIILIILIAAIQIFTFVGSIYNMFKDYEDKVDKLTKEEIDTIYKSSFIMAIVLIGEVYAFAIPNFVTIVTLIPLVIVFLASAKYFLNSLLKIPRNHIHDNDYE